MNKVMENERKWILEDDGTSKEINHELKKIRDLFGSCGCDSCKEKRKSFNKHKKEIIRLVEEGGDGR